MSEVDPEVRRTPLEAEHRALGAHLGAFAGWLMPIEYRGTLSEHAAVREAVGLFDLTHLGKIVLEGSEGLEVLQRALTNDVSRVGPGGAQYNLVLNERGGIVDDLIVYRVGEQRYLVVPNAANTLKVRQALVEKAETVDVVLREDLSLIAPQGPRSFDLVERLFAGSTQLEYMHCMGAEYHGEPVIVSRSGYTGERGFELFVPETVAAELWRDLVKQGEPLGVQACGLGARDTLRLEMGYPPARQRHLGGAHPARGRAGVGGRLRQGGVRRARRAGPPEGAGDPGQTMGPADE